MVYNPQIVTEEMVDLNTQLMSLHGAQKAYLAALRAIATIFGARRKVIRSIVDHLDEITVPTLVMWGEEDKILPVDHAYVAAEAIPDARLHIFPRCGHTVQLEKAEGFNPRVMAFLNAEAS